MFNLVYNYKAEKKLKKIMDKDAQYHDKNKHVKLLIYYKNIFFLLKQNSNTNIKTPNISENYKVINKYTRNKAPSNETYTHRCYVGHMTTNAKDRIKQHSSIKRLFTETINKILMVP